MCPTPRGLTDFVNDAREDTSTGWIVLTDMHRMVAWMYALGSCIVGFVFLRVIVIPRFFLLFFACLRICMSLERRIQTPTISPS